MKNKFLKGLVVSFALTVSCVANAGLIPFGIQNDTDVDLILDNGWDYLYRENAGATSYIADVFGSLSNDDWIIVAGIRNSDDMVLAHAAVTWGEFSTYTSANATHTFNGVDWYYNGSSMGFTAIGDSITQNSADTSSYVDDIKGLSIHTNYDNGSHTSTSGAGQNAAFSPMRFGSGWSMGNVKGLNSSSEYDYAFFVEKFEEVPEPSTLAIFALSLMGLASRKFKKQA